MSEDVFYLLQSQQVVTEKLSLSNMSLKAEKKSKIANTGMESKVILCTCGRSDLAFEDFLPCPMTATGLVGPNLVAAVVAVFAVSIESKGEGRR